MITKYVVGLTQHIKGITQGFMGYPRRVRQGKAAWKGGGGDKFGSRKSAA